jgi:hypothetical protein
MQPDGVDHLALDQEPFRIEAQRVNGGVDRPFDGVLDRDHPLLDLVAIDREHDLFDRRVVDEVM